MEGTGGAKTLRCEGSGKKSKKRLKQKRVLETDKDNTQGIHGMPDAADAVPSVTDCEVAQVCSRKKREKKSKVLEDAEKVMGWRENIPDNEQHGTLKKKSRRKSKVEPSDATSVEMSVQGDARIEDDDSRKPSDPTWVQTASWKSLVGETGRVTFSLGSMLRQNSDLQMSPTAIAPAQSSMDELPSNHVSSWIEGPSAPRLGRSTMLSNGRSNSSHVENTYKLTMKAQAQSDAAGHWNPGSVKTLDVASGSKGDRDVGEREATAASLDCQLAGQIDDRGGAGGKVCRFMRSENYEQEWLDAKRAVKDIFKRTHKDALRSMKMFHKKQHQ